MTCARRDAAALWVGLSAWCVATGWVLSLLQALNATGYAIAAGSSLVCWWVFRRINRSGRCDSPAGPAFRWKRYQRPGPLFFLGVCGLATIGGLLHSPNNYDALTYRVPRLLHWLAEGQWHWITTPNERMNYSGAGAEWLLGPLLAWTQGDRLFALPSLVSFFLLPGLVFSLLKGTGVRTKVAWRWMWLLPLGFGYVLQAGSTGNDLIPATYALASVCFALKARRNGSGRAAAWSLISAALVTGVKASNMPLALPSVLLLLPVLPRLVRQAPVRAAGAGLLALAVSFVPLGVLNHLHAGHWGGDPKNEHRLQITNPAAGLAGNALIAITQNLAPPVLPSPTFVEELTRRVVPESVFAWIKRGFPRWSLRLAELPQEETAGLGVCVVLLLVASRFAGRSRSQQQIHTIPFNRERRILLAGAGIALAVFMMKLGSEATARLLLPYYALFTPWFLAPSAAGQVMRTRWWRVMSRLCAGFALFAMIVTPARPLIPAGTIFHALAERPSSRPLWRRAEAAYDVYAKRSDMLGSLRQYFPAGTRELTVALELDDSEISLWRPFGSRRVRHVTVEAVARDARVAGEWFVTKSNLIPGGPAAAEAWAAGLGGQVVGREHIVSRVSTGPQEWLVIRFARP